MNAKAPSYHGHRFPPEIISHAVWLYYRFCLSFRDVEDLLAMRGVIVSYETIRQWSRGRTLLSQATERPGKRTAAAGHRQAEEL
jgi:putative transposase